MGALHKSLDADVAVIGLGPVGMALAGLLGRRGIRVIAVERDRDVFPEPRAAHIDHQGLRVLQEMGCLDELLPRMITNPGLDFINADDEVLFRIPGNQPSVSGLPASMYFHQPPFDHALRAAIEVMPTVDVRLGVEMTGFTALPDQVVVNLRDESGAESTISARWLVGCDGSWSSVREMAGIPLQDYNFDETWVVVDLLLKRPIDTLPECALNVCDPLRPTTAIPIPDGRFRFEVMALPGEDPEELRRPDNFLPLLRKWVPADAVEIERSAVYTFHGLLAERWRTGRVLLAGDAAHQMPPFLGQGMNSGLRDAANLAWKLALVIDGRGSDALLDTYETERMPHVREIMVAAIEYGRMTCTLDPVVAAERDLKLRHDPRPLNRRLPFRLPPLTPGPLVREGGGELSLQPLPNGSNLRFDDFVGQRFLVLGRKRAAFGESEGWWTRRMGALVVTLDDLPEEFAKLGAWLDRRLADVVVVRPDRYVAAATTNLDVVTRDVAHLFTSGSTALPAELEDDART